MFKDLFHVKQNGVYNKILTIYTSQLQLFVHIYLDISTNPQNLCKKMGITW